MVHTENYKLMYFSKFFHQGGRCHTISHFPPGIMKGFSERSSDETAPRKMFKLCHAEMFFFVKNHVFINFIAENKKIIFFSYLFQLHQILFCDNSSCRIMRRVDDDHFRF